MLQFDEVGIAECPGCKAYVCDHWKHCVECGTLLPPPPKKCYFPESDPQSENHLDFEVIEKKGGKKFCSQCGIKL